MTKKYRFKGDPAPYQKQAVVNALKNKSYGVFFEQRVGKTRVGVDYAGALSLLGGYHKCLIVCPVSALQAWLTQIAEYLPDEIPYTVYRYAGKVPPSKDKLLFVLATYDQVRIHWKALSIWKPDAVIADEVHKLKNPSSQRSRAMRKVAKNVKYRLGLTGTPIAQRPVDIFGVFRWIDESLFGSSFPEFKRRYCIMGGYMGYSIVGYQPGALEDIAQKTAKKSLRVLRKDVLEEPDIEELVLSTVLDTTGREHYDAMRREMMTELETGKVVTGDIPLTKLLRLQQITGGFLDGEPVSTAKLLLTESLLVDLLEEDEKVVIFCRFTAELKALMTIAHELKANPVHIDGSVPEKKRAEAIAKFKSDPSCKVIVLQQSAGNAGFSLAVANRVVFYSMSFSLVEYLQAKDRVMGREQASSLVTYYFITAEKTVDNKVMRDIRKGIDVASRVANQYKYYLEE